MNPTLPTYDTLRLVGPELILVLGMCTVILTPFARRAAVGLHTGAAVLALVAALVAAGAALSQPSASILGGMLTIDPFSQAFKIILLLLTTLVVLQWIATGRDRLHPYDVPDFLCLLLGATFGMALMSSAANLLMIFVATEASSYPSYALAGFRKQTRAGAEGALKYVVFGAAASAIMLYGMSLIYGVTGTLDLATVAQHSLNHMTPMLALGILAMLAGVAFKLSAVPLHFWCPDVFQSAPTEVTTFLSVASKGAAVALLARIVQSFGVADGAAGLTGLAIGLAILGGVTATWGNLVAYHQNNIKRLLAYSSIAHAGYMIMALALVPVARAAAGTPAVAAMQETAGAILFYLVVYLFMNLGAFTVAAILAQGSEGTEDIRDYAGLIWRAPAPAAILIVCLLSLFGMPGLGGFMGKIYLALAMLQTGGATGFVLVGVLLVNTLLSLYLYMRPVYYMVFAKPAANAPTVPTAVRLPGLALGILVVCVLALLVTGVLPGPVAEMTHTYATIVVSPVLTPAVALAP